MDNFNTQSFYNNISLGCVENYLYIINNIRANSGKVKTNKKAAEVQVQKHVKGPMEGIKEGREGENSCGGFRHKFTLTNI